jgi:hypothetical protein
MYAWLIEPLAEWKFAIDVAGAVCAFIAAGFWLRASLVKTPKELRRLIHMPPSGPIEGDLADLARGVSAQSRWNALAATFAAAAAVMTGMSVLIGTRWGP